MGIKFLCQVALKFLNAYLQFLYFDWQQFLGHHMSTDELQVTLTQRIRFMQKEYFSCLISHPKLSYQSSLSGHLSQLFYLGFLFKSCIQPFFSDLCRRVSLLPITWGIVSALPIVQPQQGSKTRKSLLVFKQWHMQDMLIIYRQPCPSHEFLLVLKGKERLDLFECCLYMGWKVEGGYILMVYLCLPKKYSKNIICLQTMCVD